MKTIVLLLSFLISIIPIIIFGYTFYNKDTIKEPKRLLSYLFISGMFSAIIVIIISIAGLLFFPKLADISKIDSILILLFYSYIFIALIEESSKLLMIYKLSYYNKEFNQAYDIILYSVFVALGFAFFENIVYLISNPALLMAFLRGITAVPAHICFQTIMGYFLYLSKLNNKDKYIFLGLLIPCLLHGTYDFFIFTGSIFLIILDIVLLIIMFIIANQKIKKLIEIDKKKFKIILY